MRVFREIPPIEYVNKIFKTLGLRDMADTAWFSKSSIRLQEFEELLPELEPYYVPCKAHEYIHQPLTQIRVVTIIRQLLKAHGATLNVCEKSCGGEKKKWYQVSGSASTSVTVSFD